MKHRPYWKARFDEEMTRQEDFYQQYWGGIQNVIPDMIRGAFLLFMIAISPPRKTRVKF